MFKEDGNVIHFSAPKGMSYPQGFCLQILQEPTINLSPSNSKPPHPHHLESLVLNTRFTVHASVPSNTFAVYGNAEEKELTELVPGILNQLGPDSLASLRKLAESYQSMQKKDGGAGGEGAGKGGGTADDDDDDEIPELVEGENFESKVE